MYKLKKTNIFLISALLFCYLLSLIFAFPYLIEVKNASDIFDLVRTLVEYGCMFLSFFVFVLLLFKNKNLRPVSIILILCLTLNFGISVAAALVYRSGINIGMALSILDTNYAETYSMASMFVLPIIISIVFLIIFLKACTKQIINNKRKQLLVAFSLIWLILPTLFALKHTYISNKGGSKMIKSVFFLSNQFVYAAELRREAASIHKTQVNLKKEKIGKGIKNIIVVIGESARKQNMSLYGYHLNTTPYARENKTKMLLYTNAVSPAAITNISVPLVLSSIEADEFKNNFKKISSNIINLANQNGYETYWLSMQGGARGITSIAGYANHKKWLNGFDKEIVPELRNILSNNQDQKLVFLHLNGSHPNPCDRFPDSFSDPKLDCYDTSIKYTDKLLGEIFKEANQLESVVIYFSDHSLKLSGEKFLHTDSKESTQVPFFLWYSDLVPKANRDIRSVSEITQTTYAYPLILKNMGLKTPLRYKSDKLEYVTLDLNVIPQNTLMP